MVLAVFVVGALVAVAGARASFRLDPLFQRETFSWGIVFGAIPIAALSFIGFDAISTLNEEAEGGGSGRVASATMIVLFAITVIFVLQVYVAASSCPTARKFADGDATNNAFYDIAGDGRRGLVQDGPHPHRRP